MNVLTYLDEQREILRTLARGTELALAELGREDADIATVRSGLVHHQRALQMLAGDDPLPRPVLRLVTSTTEEATCPR
ncbi:MAG: hypothetical protein QOG85_150 [Gaiellaceae bacterium]|jgi:hypothetical protein|nr:hypothetical protein [Gaiellaceae bacterium]